MNKFLRWISTKFVGKKTYTAVALLLLHQAYEYYNVPHEDQSLSVALDAVLALAIGVIRAAVPQKEEVPEK